MVTPNNNYAFLIVRHRKNVYLFTYFFPLQLKWLGAVHKCQHLHKCTNHTLSVAGRGVCENQNIFRKLLTSWPDLYYFHGDFWHSKNVDVYSFLGGGWGLRKYMVCINVDIYGRPLRGA